MMGNIWMATERGLSRYDGRKFVNFQNFGSSFAGNNIRGFFLHPSNPSRDLLALTHDERWIRIKSGKATIDSTLKSLPLVTLPEDTLKPVPVRIETLPFPYETSIQDLIHRVVATYPGKNGVHFTYNGQSVDVYRKSTLQRRFVLKDKSFFRFFQLGRDFYYLDHDALAFRFGERGNSAEMVSVKGIHAPDRKGAPAFEIYWNNAAGQVFLASRKSLTCFL